MEEYFVLDERGEPRPEPDVEVWTRWFEQADRGIARTSVSPDVAVLTTFRAVDEAPEPGVAPRLYDTHVFGGVLDGEEVASATRDEAVAAHEALVQWCRIGNAPDAGVTEETLARSAPAEGDSPGLG